MKKVVILISVLFVYVYILNAIDPPQEVNISADSTDVSVSWSVNEPNLMNYIYGGNDPYTLDSLIDSTAYPWWSAGGTSVLGDKYFISIVSKNGEDDSPEYPVIISAPHTGDYSITTDSDVDWYRIQLDTTDTYMFSNSSPTNLDSYLDLYGPGDPEGTDTGQEVAYDDNSGGDSQPLLSYSPDEKGYYFLKTAAVSKIFGMKATGDYTLNVVKEPYLNLDYPAGGEELIRGNTYSIRYRDNISDSIRIELYQNDAFLSLIDSFVVSNGSYDWQIPISMATATDYKIRIVSVNDEGLEDFSSTEFTVKDPFITVTYPVYNDNIMKLNPVEITWDDDLDGNVRIELYRNNTYDKVIVSSTPSDGHHYVSTLSSSGGFNCSIQIKSTDDYNIVDRGGNFTIQEPPYVLVTYPNGGEEILKGEVCEIRWWNGRIGTISVDLYKGGVLHRNLATDIPYNYDWTVPNDLATAGDYKIKVTNDNISYSDYSNSYFTIRDPYPSLIENVVPAGVESFTTEEQIDISWEYNLVDSVRIKLYKSGVFESFIADSLLNTGLYSWDVPEIEAGTDYSIKVINLNDSLIYGESQEYFTIIASDMEKIAAGSFNMGYVDGDSDEQPVHNVEVSQFFMGKTEVTQQEWIDVMGTNPAFFDNDMQRPVESVSWYDALVYCNKSSITEGLDPCYTINGTTDSELWGITPTKLDSVWNAAVCDFDKNGYRLPSEAEWEYAARYNDSRIYPWGSTAPEGLLCNYANLLGYTNLTGSYSPSGDNGTGLSDMAGNVWEYVWDRYGIYQMVDQTNPDGPETGNLRVVRGGAFSDGEYYIRTTYRLNKQPFESNNSTGLRIVRSK